jgi:hypothetical protein
MAHNAVMTLVVIAVPIVTTPDVAIESHRSQRPHRSPDESGTLQAGIGDISSQLGAQQRGAIEQKSHVVHPQLPAHGLAAHDVLRLPAELPPAALTREAAP